MKKKNKQDQLFKENAEEIEDFDVDGFDEVTVKTVKIVDEKTKIAGPFIEEGKG